MDKMFVNIRFSSLLHDIPSVTPTKKVDFCLNNNFHFASYHIMSYPCMVHDFNSKKLIMKIKIYIVTYSPKKQNILEETTIKYLNATFMVISFLV